MTREELLSEIEAHAAKWGIAPATVTSRAVSNSRLYHRMKAGGACNLDTAQRLRTYMDQAEREAAAPEAPTPEEDAA
jgi:hypothetical protein